MRRNRHNAFRKEQCRAEPDGPRSRIASVLRTRAYGASRGFTRSKSNISIDTGGFAYSIDAQALPSGVTATRIVWGEALEGNARDILESVEGNEGNTKPVNQQHEAMNFLHSELKDGPVPARDLLARAKKDFGLTERTLQRAKDKLGIVVTKSGFHGGWVWSYPFDFGIAVKSQTL